jgi:23S rRNA pseudouridine2605 synthase
MSLTDSAQQPRDFSSQVGHGARMAQPPKRPSSAKPPARSTKPPRLRWDSKPARKPRPDAVPSKGALERKDGEERIAKLLARAGVASRREIERMIADGRVTLNGEKVETPATLLKSLHGVSVDGQPVKQPEPTKLYLFHKPANCLTAERDFSGRKTIYDILPKDLPRLMPIGRLDLNTEGLLLLTNDGEFKRQMELPSTGVERTYRARAFGDISQAQLEELIHGIEIEGTAHGAQWLAGNDADRRQKSRSPPSSRTFRSRGQPPYPHTLWPVPAR